MAAGPTGCEPRQRRRAFELNSPKQAVPPIPTCAQACNRARYAKPRARARLPAGALLRRARDRCARRREIRSGRRGQRGNARARAAHFRSPPGFRPSIANTSPVGDRDAWVDQHGSRRWHRQRCGKQFPDAAHPPSAGVDADRHVGTDQARHLSQAGIAERDAIGAGQQAERRAGIGGTRRPGPPRPAGAFPA